MADQKDKEKNKAKDKKPKKKKPIDFNPNSVVLSLEELLEEAKNNNIKGFVFAGLQEDNEPVFTICDLSLYDNISLVGYLQNLAAIRTLTETLFELDEDE